MAEGDRFEQAFGAGWRSAYRRAREGVASPEEVADKLVESLARTLREEHGIPGLLKMEEVTGNAAWRLALDPGGVEEAAILIESFNALDQIVRDLDGHRHAKVAADVAKSRLVQQGAHTGDQGTLPTPGQFVEGICKALIENYFFATARGNLVAEGKVADHGQARGWQHDIEGIIRPSIREMAQRLMKDPDAKALRAPNRMVKQQATGDLLAEDLVATETQRPGGGRHGN